jgi:TRAP transporter TAXI family solute receptor
MTCQRRLASAFLLLVGLLLAGCDKAPDAGTTRRVMEERLAGAMQPPVTQVASFRRLGSGPLPATADGKARRIVYYNAVLELTRDINFASWNGLNATAFATLLGATEQGVIGIKPDGNRSGDQLRIHGSATFVKHGPAWAAVPWVAAPLGTGSPDNNTGPPSEATRLLAAVAGLLQDGTLSPRRSDIVAEELAKALGWMQLRLDRLDRVLVVAGGQPGGEYAGVAGLIAAALAGRDVPASAIATSGGVENARLLHGNLAEVALIQNDVAGMAAHGTGPFAADGAMAELRALGSLFPEPVQVVVKAGSPLTSIAELKGQRVELASEDSGTRANAEALLAASGVGLGDLASVTEMGLAAGLELLARDEVDAVIATVAVPARALQAAAAAGTIGLLPIGAPERAVLVASHPDLVPVTLPANTYPGQAQAVDTVAATALLVATAGMPDSAIEGLLQQVYGGIDFLQAGSAAGSLIARTTARVGLTLPLHPAAERFLLRPVATQ